MADPAEYHPSYSYSGFQASTPGKPLPAPQIDNDFAQISAAINDHADAIEDVRRSDGALVNEIVTRDSLAPDTVEWIESLPASQELIQEAVDAAYPTALLVMPPTQTVQPSPALSTPTLVRGILERGLAFPEMFYDGDFSANPTQSTAAINKALATGKPVELRAGTYAINGELAAPAGQTITMYGHSCKEQGTFLQVDPAYAGIVIHPSASYELGGFTINGSGLDGCVGVGGEEAKYSGFARMRDMRVISTDRAICFGPSWQHPIGLDYQNIECYLFRTVGLSIGGPSGGTSLGESCWNFRNMVITNGGQPGVAASGIAVVNTDSTHDTISWSGTTPYWGWCVLRSSDGLTNWHIPPNWTSAYFTGTSFVATKLAAETWNYTVVRMTVAMAMRRGFVATIDAAQVEYCGIGLYLGGMFGADVSGLYTEHRDPTGGQPPRPNYAGAVVDGGFAAISMQSCDRAGYGAVALGNGKLDHGDMRASNLFYSAFMQTGASQQHIKFSNPQLVGTTPALITAPTGGASEHSYEGSFLNTTTMQLDRRYDGIVLPSISLYKRGVLRGGFAGDGQATEELQLTADRLVLTRLGKALRGRSVNKTLTTTLTNNTATPVATIDIATSNGSVGLSIPYLIYAYSSGVHRQVLKGTLEVAIVNASGTLLGAISATIASALQAGTLPTPTWSIAFSGTVGTISVSANTSIASPTIICMLGEINDQFGGGTGFTATQL